MFLQVNAILVIATATATVYITETATTAKICGCRKEEHRTDFVVSVPRDL